MCRRGQRASVGCDRRVAQPVYSDRDLHRQNRFRVPVARLDSFPVAVAPLHNATTVHTAVQTTVHTAVHAAVHATVHTAVHTAVHATIRTTPPRDAALPAEPQAAPQAEVMGA